MRVAFSPRAVEDLHEIWHWIARHDLKAADWAVDAIHARSMLLSEYPQLGTPRPEIDAQARVLVAKRWLIFYRVDLACITVVRIIDGVRDLREMDWPE